MFTSSARAARRLTGMRPLGCVLVALAACNSEPAGSKLATSTSRLSTSIQFVQVAATVPQSNSSTVALKYAAAQAAGDLNVIAVGWNDTTSSVTSVTDTSGNNYALAVGPTKYPGALTQ